MRFAVFILAAAGLSSVSAQELLRQELPTNYAPAELLRPAIQKVLSPQGRFVILDGKSKVLVIDHPDKVAAAANAIANLDAPEPEIALNLGVRTGGRPKPGNARVLGPVESRSDFPYPTRYDPPRIVVGPNGTFAVTPAHPTDFRTRNLGITMETQATVNPDGSINLSINREDVEFQGFINYGSPILSLGNPGAIPLLDRAGDPSFFAPFVTENKVLVPIFETTRISTSVVVYPQMENGMLKVHLLPQLNITEQEYGWKSKRFQLRQFRTAIDLQNGRVEKLRSFKGAPEDFARHFFCDDEQPDGIAQIVLKAEIRPGKVE